MTGISRHGRSPLSEWFDKVLRVAPEPLVRTGEAIE